MRKSLLLLLTGIFFFQTFAQHSILIRNISIIDVEKGVTLRSASVLIRDSMIEKIVYAGGAPAECHYSGQTYE